MRLLRFLDPDGRERLGCDPRGGTAELVAGDLLGAWRPTGERVPFVRLLAPVLPRNLFGIGLNYREHARLMGLEVPDRPVVFMKPSSTVTGPGDPILLPRAAAGAPEVDYEGELAVIIGRAARDVPVSRALSCVLGYTAANDVTARQWARASRVRGKGFDSFCPLGPILVTADEIPDPQSLELVTRLNGVTVQRGNTADMVFPVAELISYLSQDTTLLPGTVILTGTLPGSGVTRSPPVYLADGDQVEVELERIGTLANPVRAVAAPGRAAA
jgi:2-keto-4-pentenoate hydratase/2-oxohepta-3-ene-1,7-dioic acid hydratase in catechol pathway